MECDCIVIGSGIIGLSTAIRLLEEGASVTLLERRKAGYEASWAGGGILSPLPPWNYPDTVTRLATYSMSRYPEWVATLHTTTGIDPEYQLCGLLVLPPYDLEAATRWCSSHTVSLKRQLFSYSTGAGSAGITGYISRPADQALFLPSVAQVRNPYLLQALYKRVKQLKGNIIEYCEVQKLNITNQKIDTLQTSCGKFSAAQYILATGAWSRQVLGEHGLNLEIRPIRGQMLLYKFPVIPLQSVVLQQDLYLIPRLDGHLLIGSTTEDAGFDKRTTQSARDRLINWATNLLPGVDTMPLLKHWSGLRPATPDNIPVIGLHPFLKNLYLNSGHFRYGMTMAPASAEILVNEILNRAQPFDVTPYYQGRNIFG